MTKSEIVTLLVVLIAYQAYATLLVMKSDHFDDTQKLRQVVFIWLIPIVGAVLVRIALNAAERAAKPTTVYRDDSNRRSPRTRGPDTRV